MQVYDITARFSRTIQVREYEPASAELTVKAQLADGESPEKVSAEVFKLIGEQVHLALGLSPNTKLPARARAAKSEETPPATSAKAPAKTTAATPPATAASDIPGEGAPAKATTAATASDIPGDEDTTLTASPQQQAQAASDVGMTPAELSKWIGEQVRTGKVTSQAITGLYPQFGISRFADLKPEKCADAKAAVEKLISGTGAGSSTD